MSVRFIGAAAAVALAVSAGAAVAHPELRTASPAPSAVLSSAPQEVRITFNEPVLAKFSTIELLHEGSHPVKTTKPTVNVKNRAQLVARVAEKLGPGTYKVRWRVVSKDTHKVQGEYTFRLR